MEDIKIEKGISYYNAVCRTKANKYELAMIKMEIDDSFFFQNNEMNDVLRAKMMVTQIVGRSFVHERDNEGYRIWRTA